MTSRQSIGQTGRIDRPRRRQVRRGILPSFGDIVLPIVSVAAVVLMVIAGRQFFLNGMKKSPGMSSTRAYAEAPALIAERERKEAAAIPAPSVTVAQEVKPVSQDVAVNKEDDTSFTAAAEILAQPQHVETVTPSSPAPASAPKKTTPAAAATTTKKATTANTNTKAAALPANKQWRVQVGAYGTKESAQKEVNKIKKAGYKATVYSNPASKHFKVWVQGGANKASAEKVVTAMKKLGYKGPIAFPPSK